MSSTNYEVTVNDGSDTLKFDCDTLNDVMNVILDRIEKSPHVDELHIIVRNLNTNKEI